MVYTITTDKNGFNIVTLTEEQKQFINTYSPSERHYTSAGDIKKVIKIFELEGLDSRILQAIRNAVLTYNREMREGLNRDEEYERFNAMCSITAVIDHVKFTRK